MSACAPSPQRSIWWRGASAIKAASSARSSRSIEAIQPRFARRCAPSATFSITLRWPSSRTCWKVRLRPSDAKSRAGADSIGLAINCTSPSVGSSTPEIMLKKVLLPAPLGPINAWISPALTFIDTSLLATSPPKRLVTLDDCSSTVPRSGSTRRASVAMPRGTRATSARRKRWPRRSSAGHTPSAKRCNTSSIKRPNTITSKLPLVPSRPGRMSCSFSLSSVITAAPSTAPHRCPAPPTTAMNRYSMPMLRVERRGVHEALRVRIEPARDRGRERRQHEYSLMR